MSEQEIKLALENWRGYSAYEVAVQNGFDGTQQEWLESLSGGSISFSVNGKVMGTDGDIKVYAGDIKMEDGALNTVKSLMPVESNPLPVARGGHGGNTAEEARANLGAVAMSMTTATLTAGGWSANKQTVSVAGVSENSAIIVVSNPESFEQYNECAVRCVEQGNGTLAFECEEVPASDVTANVLILY